VVARSLLNVIPGQVTIKSYSTYQRGRDFYVVGEIVNSTSHYVTDVTAHAEFEFGPSVLVPRNTSAYIRVLAPQQTAPFKIVVVGGTETLNNVHISFSYSCCDGGQYPYRYPVSIISSYFHDYYGVTIHGKYVNPHPFTLYDPILVATFYNELGQVVGVEANDRNLVGLVDGPLVSEYVETFEIETTILSSEFVTYTVQAEGYAYP